MFGQDQKSKADGAEVGRRRKLYPRGCGIEVLINIERDKLLSDFLSEAKKGLQECHLCFHQQKSHFKILKGLLLTLKGIILMVIKCSFELSTAPVSAAF